ncbi:MAG: hypothetical protein RL139_1175 [Gemmatimonadota bacterium]|jgi:UDP-3-O-[3-hydroxymyristoyl] glucosamine N-acyltransferase
MTGRSGLRLAEIASAVGGELLGDPEAVVFGVAALDRAQPGQLAFLASPKYAKQLEGSEATAVLVTPDLASAPGACANRIIVARPHEAILAVIPRFHPAPVPPFRGVHPTAVVAPDAVVASDACVEAFCVLEAGARVGPGAWVGPQCHLGAGAVVGAGTRLVSQVTLYAGSEVGARGLIHAGTRIGSDGFGFVFRDGAHAKIPHVGRCLVGDDVEIGANCTIDRGSIDDTVIGDGTKLDNLVHIGHNVRVGRLCLMAAGCVVAGSARIEDGVTMAGQAAVGGHLTVGARAIITAKSGVIKDVPPGETWSGFPARPHREEMRRIAATVKLPEHLRRAAGGDDTEGHA